MNKTLAIIGSGDLGQLIAHHAINDNHFEDIVFFDDFKTNSENMPYGEIIGKTSDILKAFEGNVFDELIIGIGYKHFDARQNFFELYNSKIPFATIIHTSCYLDSTVKIGKGSFILPGCVFDKDVVIGNNIVCNISVSLSHDSEIQNHSFLGPNVSIAGFVTVKSRCMIGINSTIIDNITIADDIVIGGGAVVTKNLIQKGLYVGVPANIVI
ncbi:MAG: acetyltransferase [Bacteroidetes bacterium]|nr:acetyltransferase [Bacteroidota bacterium]